MSNQGVKKQFGLAIKNWRVKLGISQEELAWRAELHRTYVSDIERGFRNPSLQSIERLAKALNLSFTSLFQPLGDSPKIDEDSPRDVPQTGPRAR
jgi:transcriptional regulator with XRE-family HTH domain